MIIYLRHKTILYYTAHKYNIHLQRNDINGTTIINYSLRNAKIIEHELNYSFSTQEHNYDVNVVYTSFNKFAH